VKTFRCTLCGLDYGRDGDKTPASCVAVRTIKPPGCWANSPDQRLVNCAKSLKYRQFKEDTAQLRTELLKGLGEAIQQGDAVVATYLKGLTATTRYELHRSSVPELAAYLSAAIASMGGLEQRQASRPVEVPEDFPPGLREPLLRYKEKLERLYNKRLEKGHKRAPNYVWRTLLVPLRFAKHLHANGIDRWDVVRNRDIVNFCRENPTVPSSKIMPIMRFVNDHLPFRETRGRAMRSRGGERRNITPPKILPAEELDSLLAEVRETGTDAEYVLTWLVCRLGMMARPAYELPLDRVRINDAGRLVIRPAQAWLTLPRSVENLFKKIIDEAVPNWQHVPTDQLKGVVFFRNHIPNLDLFTIRVLKGKTRLLRSSAIFASMMKGQIDRVTLNQTTGVSTAYIIRLELLLSADMHRSLDPKLVKARNAHILGESND
jgi:hypothetical protein